MAGAVREPAAYETFDWDGWTGDFDAFPEEARPWMERAGGYWQAQLEEERARAASYEDLVNNYLQGQSDDPRLAEYSTRLEQAQAAHRDLEQRYQESQAAFEAMQAEQSRSYIDRFWKDNQWLKDDEQARTELYKLIDDWEPYAAVRFLKLSKEGRAAALDAKRRGAGDDFAVEYGELKGQPVVEKPRPAAALVGGASFGSMTPDVSERSPSDAKSLDDRIRLASSKTLKRFARK